MKLNTLIFFFFLSFYIGESQTVEYSRSFILLKDGKEINIEPNQKIIRKRNGYTSYCISLDTIISETKGFGTFHTYNRTFGRVKTKQIKKIVDGNTLYLPFSNYDNDKGLCRIVATNEEYFLGHFYYSKLKVDKKSKILENHISGEYYLLLDHKYNEVNGGEVYYNSSFKEKKGQINYNFISQVRAEFGECLKKDSYVEEVGGDYENEFIKFIPDPNVETNKKYRNWLIRTKAYFEYKKHAFLKDVNQLDCR